MACVEARLLSALQTGRDLFELHHTVLWTNWIAARGAVAHTLEADLDATFAALAHHAFDALGAQLRATVRALVLEVRATQLCATALARALRVRVAAFVPLDTLISHAHLRLFLLFELGRGTT